MRVAVLLSLLVVACLGYLRVWWLENWTPDWSGPQLVSVEILVPANLDADEQALLDSLENYALAGEGVPSLTALSDWFQAEQGRYGAGTGGVPVSLAQAGPTALRGAPMAPPTPEGSALERYRATRDFLAFYQGHRSTSPAPNTVYVIFYRRSANPELSKVHSVADRRSRSGFVFAALDEDGVQTAIINVGHELLHLFGASDKYDGERCAYPTGFAEPFREPRYPQRYAEVMAQGIPQGEGRREETFHGFDEARVGAETAYEIGWIDRARRDAYYRGERGVAPAGEE